MFAALDVALPLMLLSKYDTLIDLNARRDPC